MVALAEIEDAIEVLDTAGLHLDAVAALRKAQSHAQEILDSVSTRHKSNQAEDALEALAVARADLVAS